LEVKTLKIAIVTTWNIACGIYIHSWLLMKGFQELNHKVKIFAPTRDVCSSWYRLDTRDEEFVVRNWEMCRYGDKILDPSNKYMDFEPFREFDPDLIIVEKPSITPLNKLLSLLRELSDAYRLAIIHEGRKIKNKLFYQQPFDNIVVFDKRYLKIFENVNYLRKPRISIIGYPYHPIKIKNGKTIRNLLGLDNNHYSIILLYGMRTASITEIIDTLQLINKSQPIKVLIVSRDPTTKKIYKMLQREPSIFLLKEEAPPIDRLYDYLNASDVILLHRPKSKSKYIAVSSSVHLIAGSLKPIVVPDTIYFEPYKKIVLKYRNLNEFVKNILIALQENKKIEELKENIRCKVVENTPSRVTKQILELIE